MSTVPQPDSSSPASAQVVKVQFKKPGRPPKLQQPAAVSSIVDCPSSIESDQPEKKRGTLRMIYTFTETGERVPTGVYEIQGKYGFYSRPYVKGIQRKKKLDVPPGLDRATAIQKAIAKHVELLEDLKLYERGKIERDPLGQSEEKALVELCKFYWKMGFPRRKGPPIGKQLEEEKRRVEMIMKWPRAKYAWKELTLEDCQRYHDWRIKQLTRVGKGGGRTVDLELATLSNIFRCAMRNQSKTGVTSNPFFTERPRFRKAADVEHCRDFMPRNADELHALARAAFQDPRGESVGWAILFQAMIGHRINELLRLRMDAKSKVTPGFVEGSKLYLYRSTGHKGAYGHIDLYKDLQTLLEAHRIWHRKRYPQGNDWYFPSPRKEQDGPISIGAVTQALVDLAPLCGQEKRTSHGLRAYRVNVLRSQGKPDDLIALLIGQKTRGKMIVEVYGEGLDYKIGYTPEEIAPAWDKWLPEIKKTGKRAEQSNLL